MKIGVGDKTRIFSRFQLDEYNSGFEHIEPPDIVGRRNV